MSEPAAAGPEPINPWPGGPRLSAHDVSGTVRDRIASVLREQILSGELVRGARIDFDELAAQFRTSRTPVREAVLKLSHDGLTHIAPRSRATVIGLTPQDVRDNFAVMAVLSGVAAQWASQRMSDDDRDRIAAIGHQLVEAEGAELVQLNWSFHREINRACGSTPLLNQLRNSGHLVPQTFFSILPQQISCSRVEHEELLQALLDRDSERARAVTERHFLNAGSLLSRRLEAMMETGASVS